MRQRIAVGGVGLTTIVGFVLLLVAWNSAERLSAMERMARQLREVRSYSYDLFTLDTFVQEGQTQPTTVVHTGTTYWVEPASLCYKEKLFRTDGPAMSYEQPSGLLADFEGIHPAGEPGLMVYHDGRARMMAATYRWVPAVQPHEIGDSGPISRLQMVRKGLGEVLRELGTKVIEGREARGFVLALDSAPKGSGFDAVEVWVDPETDLPLEFGYEVKTDQNTRIFRISNCSWNIEIDPQVFDTTPPDGYDDITVPSHAVAFDEIASALKLYAQLSGDRYPRVKQSDFHNEFHSDAIRDGMLSLAGFTGLPQAEWTHDQKFQQIQQATDGLDWIERILRNGFNAGYYGTDVTARDNEKVLLWWNVAALESYRVFYGDLRTEILPLAEWAKLVPAEVAVHHQGDDE